MGILVVALQFIFPNETITSTVFAPNLWAWESFRIQAVLVWGVADEIIPAFERSLATGWVAHVMFTVEKMILFMASKRPIQWSGDTTRDTTGSLVVARVMQRFT